MALVGQHSQVTMHCYLDAIDFATLSSTETPPGYPNKNGNN